LFWFPRTQRKDIGFLFVCSEICNVLTPDVNFVGIAIDTDVARL
jgi:hypothetical protein